VISADEIARELMTTDQGLRREIVNIVGEGAYDGDKLDRRYVADVIFSNPEVLQRVNEAVHPRTIAEQGAQAGRLVKDGHRVVVCEAALIFETGGEDRFDYIVVVDAPREFRLERASQRDGATIEDILRREEMQMAAEEKVMRADFVIDNRGDLEDLSRNARLIAELLQVLPSREHLDDQSEPIEGEEEE
jgi:dephospho-CoA kinase